MLTAPGDQEMTHHRVRTTSWYRARVREALTEPRLAWSHITPAEREHIVAHATALGAVVAAALARWILGIPGVTVPFLLFTLAVAYSASVGGSAAAITAVLASTLLARTISSAPWALCLLFAIEAGAVALIVIRLSQAFQQHRDWLESADMALRGSKTVERQGRRIGAAFSCLQEASLEHLAITLDRDGRIAEWGEAAATLYGVDAAEAIGSSGAELFGTGSTSDEFEGALIEARKGGVPRAHGRHVHGDGTQFTVDVELRALPALTGDGFTLLIHDLTRQEGVEATNRLAAEREQGLRDELADAHRQLASIRSVSDPHFDALPGGNGATALLDRLRSEINADGIAIVRAGAYRESIVSAPEGVQPDPSRLQGEARPQRGRRTVLIHNDPARVSEMTTVGWPDDVRTLIAVPVIRAGEVEAMIEVAYLRGRRSTEWEISLIQIAATRVTGLLNEAAYAKTGAVA
jgi:PAS domain S-box-containing protein